MSKSKCQRNAKLQIQYKRPLTPPSPRRGEGRSVRLDSDVTGVIDFVLFSEILVLKFELWI